MRPDQPFFRFDWILANLDEIGRRLGEHVLMTVGAVSIGFVVSFVLALAIRRSPRLYAPILGVTGVLYAIPSLALFSLLIPFTGLSLLTAEIALVIYTLLILVRNLVTALNGVPAEVLEAADGMGLTGMQRLWRVELPIAAPVIVAGVRIATVTIVGLVTVTALIGVGGLGYLIVNSGIQRSFATSIYTGVVLSVALAAVLDLALLWLQRSVTPWARMRSAPA
jgi:osmoprotectant transport system permease protein